MDGRVFIAAAPFNKSSADLVVRSSDNVDFHLHKQILALTSEFFEFTFSIPQPSRSHRAPHETDCATGLPLVRVTEDADTLNALFRFCYPTARPTFRCIADIQPVMMAAAKYQMEEVSSLLQEQLLALKDSPLRLYALACELELEDVARIAAERCYTRGYTTAYVPEMKRITAAQHYRLMYFSLHGFSGDRALRFVSCIRQRQPSLSLYAILSSICAQADLHPFQANAYADTIILSMDGIAFYVNRYIISMAAPTFFEHQQVMPGPSAASLPVYKLDEHSTVITILLTLIHPLPEPQFSNMEALGAITEAAVKYNMPRAVEILKRRWMGLIHTASLRVYFTMMRYGWECDAEQAAIHAAYDGKDEYVPEMEDVSSLAYRRFLLFRRHRRLAVVSHVSFLLANLNGPLNCRRNKERWRQLYWNKAGEWPNNLDAFALQVMGDAPLHGWHGSCVRALVIAQSLDQFTEEGQAMANESAEIMLLGLVAFERDIKQVFETITF